MSRRKKHLLSVKHSGDVCSHYGEDIHTISPPWGKMFALVPAACVTWYVFKDEHTNTPPVAVKFQRHGQTTCLTHGSFLKAVCPAGTDSIWKTRLNESTHQLHQRILTSPASPSHLTLLSFCLGFSHCSVAPFSLFSAPSCPRLTLSRRFSSCSSATVTDVYGTVRSVEQTDQTHHHINRDITRPPGPPAAAPT